METTEAMMVVLPDDLLADILGRLPARSLAASQRVCKAWRDLIGQRQLLLRLRRLVPHAVRGLFINYQDYDKPHFFSRPAAGPRIEGKIDSIVSGKGPYRWPSWHKVVDHCNGLVLYRDSEMKIFYVCNPTTRRWARLPPGPRGSRAFLVFDPAVSPDYKVLLAPKEPSEKEKDACRLMEWPPSPWVWHEFSSRRGRWETKVFVREGEAAGTVGELLFNSMGFSVERRWRYAAYWQGELYIHCRGEYVSRLSLLNDKYQVIKSPIDLAECKNNNVRSFLGRSEKGVYFAAMDPMDKLRVWILSESSDHQMGWVSKHQSTLKTNSWWLHEKKYDELKIDAPWTMDIPNTKRYKDIQQDVCWNSDGDDIIDVSDDEEDSYDRYVRFLGFHPYKEVIFLCRGGYAAVACHLNSSKVQYLGEIHLGGIYNRGERESFVYTPCLDWRLAHASRKHLHI